MSMIQQNDSLDSSDSSSEPSSKSILICIPINDNRKSIFIINFFLLFIVAGPNTIVYYNDGEPNDVLQGKQKKISFRVQNFSTIFPFVFPQF